jgi:hypothetical protein
VHMRVVCAVECMCQCMCVYPLGMRARAYLPLTVVFSLF